MTRLTIPFSSIRALSLKTPAIPSLSADDTMLNKKNRNDRPMTTSRITQSTADTPTFNVGILRRDRTGQASGRSRSGTYSMSTSPCRLTPMRLAESRATSRVRRDR